MVVVMEGETQVIGIGGGGGGGGAQREANSLLNSPSHDAAEASAAALGPLPIFAVRSTGP